MSHLKLRNDHVICHWDENLITHGGIIVFCDLPINIAFCLFLSGKRWSYFETPFENNG